ncbi:MAG: DUF4147 domain-containing protein [Acidobacteria bacterium]|nr:DUF4147 domain-containing protein [Acidobacteriota bacterium]
MIQAACAALRSRVTSGVAVGQRGAGLLPGHIEWLDGAHPLPDERSLRAASRALELAGEARVSGEALLVLLSGGASAMLAAPAGDLSLEDKQRTTTALMRAGAEIGQLNCVRKHLSLVKGGRLGVQAGRCVTLAISDVHVPADDPATIGSGPTSADPTTYADAISVLGRLRCQVPVAVRTHLERGAAGEIAETPKPGDGRLRDTSFTVIANRHAAVRGATLEASRRGYIVHVIERPTQGEAAVSGRRFVEAARAQRSAGSPSCVIGSGETTVTVAGDGRGGRNQEFVLGAAALLTDPGVAVVVASAGTDGVDGPTDASGAMATSTTVARCAGLGIELDDVLARNDAYTALGRLGDLVKWGPSMTNVGDVHVVLTMRA